MYQWIAKRQIRKGFAQISAGDFDTVLKLFADDVHFTFAGDHALGADVHQREGACEWFARVGRIFPGLKLEAEQIFVAGPPWDMVITTRFHVHDTLPDQTTYDNHGVQIVRIRLGQVVEDHLLEDTLVLQKVLTYLSALGQTEADAPPLADHPGPQTTPLQVTYP
ncbi:MAG: nuclear transport factor 2 family protein [Anaerolineae bacterium]|nr:nuclear transport factor 2 family protein [Anaerolineae bacterium]